MHAFLSSAGKLEAAVDFSLASPGEVADDGMPLTLGHLVYKYAPRALPRALAAKAAARQASAARSSRLQLP